MRERAVNDPRAAEILLRWLQRPRPLAPESDALAALSVEQLERLHQGLMRIFMPAEAPAQRQAMALGHVFRPGWEPPG